MSQKHSYRLRPEVVLLTTHQVCTPLTAIKGYISFIQEGTYGMVPEKVNQVLHTIQHLTDELVETVRSLSQLTK